MKRLAFLLFSLVLLLPLVGAYGVTFYNPAWNPQDGKLFEKVDAGKAYVIELDEPDLAIKKMTFKVDKNSTTAGITAYHLKTIPTFLPDMNDSFEYNELKYGGFATHNIKSIIFEFAVPKDWLTENKVSRDTISMFWHKEMTDSWESLPTSIIDEDDEFVYFDASIGQGARYFAIAREQEAVPDVVVETGAVEEDAEEQEVEGPVEDKGPSAEESESETESENGVSAPEEDVEVRTEPLQTSVPPAPEPEPEASPGPEDEAETSKLRYLFYVFLVVLAIFLIYFFVTRSPARPGVDKEIYKYIKQSRKNGKSRDQIKKRLLDVGWHPDRVEKALSKHKFEPSHKVEKKSAKKHKRSDKKGKKSKSKKK